MTSDKFKSLTCESLRGNVTKSEYTVQPKTKEELLSIIEKTIKEQGPECDLNFIDTSLITDMSYLFAGSNFNGDISKWNVSKVWNMRYMFFRAESFNQPIGNWNVSKVKNMISMFSGAKDFNQPIGDWDVSKVEDMRLMFDGAESFNQLIGKWDVSRVRNMYCMFDRSPLFFNPPRWYKN